MSRIAEVIKNKNRVEKIRRGRRKDEMTAIRQESAFKVRLYDELRKIDVLFETEEVTSVIVEIPDEFLPKFGLVLYSEDLAEYIVTQVEGYPNRFSIERKYIAF